MITRYKTSIQRRKKSIRAKIKRSSSYPRLSVYRSNLHIYAQLIELESGNVLAEASDLKLKKKMTKLARAKLVGEDIAKKIKKAKIKSVVFDRSGYKYHGRVKALCEAVRDSGIQV